MRLGKRVYTFEPVLADRLYFSAAGKRGIVPTGARVVKCAPAGIGMPARGFSIGGRFCYVADADTGEFLGMVSVHSLKAGARG